VFADEDQRSYVYLVQADGKHVKHPVGVGKRTEGKVEIVRGLKAGDKVLLQKPSGDKE
jgi:hypothetical protein